MTAGAQALPDVSGRTTKVVMHLSKNGGEQARAASGTSHSRPLDDAPERVGFGALISRYRPRLLRIVRSILREDGDVEDVMQQVFMLVYRKQSSYAGHSSFETWLTRLTINEALAHRRAHRRWQSYDSIETLAESLEEDAPTPEEHAALRELAQLVSYALEALPVDYRRVTVLRELHGMNGHDTARELGVTRTVVRVRLCRARALLRQHLARQFGRSFTRDALSTPPARLAASAEHGSAPR